MTNICAWYYSVTREQIIRETLQMFFLSIKDSLLGHVISDEGIVVETTKVEAIMECRAPTNVPEVCSFVGLEGYYRRFVKDRKSDCGIAE
jgi:hypothetical protein